MRFLLDNDVDARLAGVLHKIGHEAWTAAQLGMPDATDVELAIVSQERGAVCVTHDAEFTDWVKKHTFHSHVRLRCPEPDAVDVMCHWLDDVVQVLSRKTKVIVLGKTVMNVYPARW